MGSAIAFIVWMFCIRYCTYQGAKRIIGPYSGFVLGALFNIWGIWMVRSSRLLLDGKEAVLIEEPAV
jgi:hypothetical protein